MTMPWRGNIRELKNLIYRLALVCREDVITEATVAQYIEPGHDAEAPVQGASFEAAVTQFLRDHRLRGIFARKDLSARTGTIRNSVAPACDAAGKG